jgi:hypothetical protein
MVASLAAIASCQDGPPASIGAMSLGLGSTEGSPSPAASASPLMKNPTAREQALAQAKPMAIRAAAGGLYRGADGLEVAIPPGALSADAQVRFGSTDTAGLPPIAGSIPGMAVDVDFGGAQLKPGQAVNVKAAVDPRFVAALQGSDAAKESLTRDASGRWFLTMQMKSPDGSLEDRMHTTPIDAQRSMTELTAAAIDAVASRTVLQAASGERTPLITGDKVVDAYPFLAEDKVALPEYGLIVGMELKAGKQSWTIKGTLTETVFGDYHDLICYLGPACGWEILKLLDGGVRFNKGIKANRQPPLELADKVRGPVQLSCDFGPSGGTSSGIAPSFAPVRPVGSPVALGGASAYSLQGKVRDAAGQPLISGGVLSLAPIGVTVNVVNGNYVVNNVPSGTKTITFTLVQPATPSTQPITAILPATTGGWTVDLDFSKPVPSPSST